MNNSLYPKGSEWRKWDLYVHSPASDGFSGIFDQFETQLKNAVKQAKVRDYEKQIDQLLYKLYGLTANEINIVENE